MSTVGTRIVWLGLLIAVLVAADVPAMAAGNEIAAGSLEVAAAAPPADDAFIASLRDDPNFAGAWIDEDGVIHLAFLANPGPVSQFDTISTVVVHTGRSRSFKAMVAEQARILESTGFGGYLDEIRGQLVIEIPVGADQVIETDFPHRVETIADVLTLGFTEAVAGWVLGSDGIVRGFGTAALTDAAVSGAVAIVATPSRDGYWLATDTGAIFSFGDAAGLASPLVGLDLAAPIVAGASSPAGDLWLVSSDGGVFTLLGNYFGSLGNLTLDEPIVAIASTPSGDGYWLVAADGGIFAFGDARFFGSVPGALPGVKLDSPIVDMAPISLGNGYLLLAADGGVFAFGDATYVGSAQSLGAPFDALQWKDLVYDGRGSYALLDSQSVIVPFGFELAMFPVALDLIDAAISIVFIPIPCESVFCPQAASKQPWLEAN